MAKHRIYVNIDEEITTPQPISNSISWKYTFVKNLFYATNGKHKIELGIKRSGYILVNLEGAYSWAVIEKQPKDPIHLELWKAGLSKKFQGNLIKKSFQGEEYFSLEFDSGGEYVLQSDYNLDLMVRTFCVGGCLIATRYDGNLDRVETLGYALCASATLEDVKVTLQLWLSYLGRNRLAKDDFYLCPESKEEA